MAKEQEQLVEYQVFLLQEILLELRNKGIFNDKDLIRIGANSKRKLLDYVESIVLRDKKIG